ncbi:MAG: hypothetical protein V3V19_11120 [Cocleimonas sp.]
MKTLKEIINKTLREIGSQQARLEDDFVFKFMYNHILSCDNWDFNNYQLIVKINHGCFYSDIIAVCLECGCTSNIKFPEILNSYNLINTNKRNNLNSINTHI